MHIMQRLFEVDNKDTKYMIGTYTLKALVARQHFINKLQILEQIHSELTLHNDIHCENVVDKASELCSTAGLFDATNQHALNTEELYYLLAGSWLHDIGHSIVRDEDIREQHKRALSTFLPIIRKDHHIRSAQYVQDNKEHLFLTSEQSDILAKVCMGHRRSEDLTSDFYCDQFGPGKFSIRVSLICSILRIADAMDITSLRAPEQVRLHFEKIGWDDPVSKFHWLKHAYTSGAKFVLEKDSAANRIVPTIIINVPDELHKETLTKLIFEQLTDELTGVTSPLARIGLAIGEPRVMTTLNQTRDKYIFKKEDIAILVVDDDLNYQENAVSRLKRSGFINVDCASDPSTAMLMPDKKNLDYHIIFIDLDMRESPTSAESSPDVGLLYIKIFDRLFPRSLIIANSNLMDHETRYNCISAGATDARSKCALDEGDFAIAIAAKRFLLVD
ncbi:MAG: HD domain-containing protein [Desulfovibrio sp.]